MKEGKSRYVLTIIVLKSMPTDNCVIETWEQRETFRRQPSNGIILNSDQRGEYLKSKKRIVRRGNKH